MKLLDKKYVLINLSRTNERSLGGAHYRGFRSLTFTEQERDVVGVETV